MINAWLLWEKSKAIDFPARKSRLNFRVRDQFEIRILKAQNMNTTYFICNWTWACDHLKSSNLSADNFKKTLELSGSIPEPAIRSCDTGQQIHYFDSCQSKHGCTISGCRLPNYLETVRLNIGIPVVRTSGRSGGRCTVAWLPNFLWWIDFLSYGASNWARDRIKYQRKT